MNERIRELYRQANEQARQQACEKNNTNRPQNNTVWNEFVPLFAQLIVQECAMLVEGFETTQEVALDEYVDYEASSVLKEHFGVE
jgi:hypothetical protein